MEAAAFVILVAFIGDTARNGKNRTLSPQQRPASAVNRRALRSVGANSYNSAWCSGFSCAAGLIFCGELDLEISQSIGLAGGNLGATSLSTAPLAYDFFRFVSGPLIDQRDAATKEALHLIAETCLRSPAAVVDSGRPHELGKRTTQDKLAALGPHRLGTHPSQDQARQVPGGELVLTA